MIEIFIQPRYRQTSKMLLQALKGFFYTFIVLSIFVTDYLLGNGVVEMLRVSLCKIICFVKKVIREEAAQKQIAGPEKPISLTVLFAEILVLLMTVMILNKSKQYRTSDRLDELLLDSKDALKQTNEFLKKWKLRKLSTEYSYLDEEPQDITPLKLEVPILHMAIIDTLGTSKSQMERGDADDAIITDSMLLSVTSLSDAYVDATEQPSDAEKIESSISNRTVELNTRYLWDVMEENADNLEDD